ncbi:lysoplasmalogenase TMEM86A [Sarcoramphus papa]
MDYPESIHLRQLLRPCRDIAILNIVGHWQWYIADCTQKAISKTADSYRIATDVESIITTAVSTARDRRQSVVEKSHSESNHQERDLCSSRVCDLASLALPPHDEPCSRAPQLARYKTSRSRRLPAAAQLGGCAVPPLCPGVLLRCRDLSGGFPWERLVLQVKSEGPKLVPFFKATCVYFVLWLPTSSPSWFSALIKCLPIFCLWVFLLAHGINFLVSHRSASRILAGLIFSAVGDAFLIWQEQGYFIHGLLMFAITHILYSSAFGMKPLDLKAGLLMGLVSSSCYAFLYSYLSGPFTYLVAVYIALIGFMGWRAVAGMQLCNDLWTWTKLSACIGAMLFMVSDLTIALNKFCFPVPYSRFIIMATYYAAQMLIALSAVESRDEEDFRKRS